MTTEHDLAALEAIRTNGDAEQLRAGLAQAIRFISDVTARFNKQVDYGIWLQRMIEAHCHGHPMPEGCLAEAAHHAEMIRAHEAEARPHKDALTEELRRAAKALLAQLDRVGMTREEEPLMDALRAALANHGYEEHHR